MVIADEYSYPVLIDSIDTPTKNEYFWVLDIENRDFKLEKLVMFEEITTRTVSFSILGYVIEVPAYWNILVYSPETSQIDIIQASELTKGNFSACLIDHKKNKVINNVVSVIDYSSHSVVHAPSLNKTSMMCHPIGPHYWACISPTDNYNKFLKDAIVGDILP